MKRNDVTALHQKTISQLEEMLLDLQRELAKLKQEKAAGKTVNKSLSFLKDNSARIKTIIKEKRMQPTPKK